MSSTLHLSKDSEKFLKFALAACEKEKNFLTATGFRMQIAQALQSIGERQNAVKLLTSLWPKFKTHLATNELSDVYEIDLSFWYLGDTIELAHKLDQSDIKQDVFDFAEEFVTTQQEKLLDPYYARATLVAKAGLPDKALQMFHQKGPSLGDKDVRRAIFYAFLANGEFEKAHSVTEEHEPSSLPGLVMGLCDVLELLTDLSKADERYIEKADEYLSWLWKDIHDMTDELRGVPLDLLVADYVRNATELAKLFAKLDNQQKADLRLRQASTVTLRVSQRSWSASLNSLIAQAYKDIGMDSVANNIIVGFCKLYRSYIVRQQSAPRRFKEQILDWSHLENYRALTHIGDRLVIFGLLKHAEAVIKRQEEIIKDLHRSSGKQLSQAKVTELIPAYQKFHLSIKAKWLAKRGKPKKALEALRDLDLETQINTISTLFQTA